MKTTTPALPRLIGPPDLVAIGITLADQKRLRATHAITYLRTGHRSVRYLESDVAEFLNARRVPAREPYLGTHSAAALRKGDVS